MKNAATVILLKLSFCFAIWLSRAVEPPVVGFLATEAGSEPSLPPSLSVLELKLADLAAELRKLPKDLRRARFQWVAERLSRLVEKGDKPDELVRFAEQLLTAARSGKDASEAVPWFRRRQWEGLRMLDNDKIGLAFVATKHGVALQSFFDLNMQKEFLSGTPAPFWSLALADASGKSRDLNSADGFGRLSVKESFSGESGDPEQRLVQMEWFGAENSDLEEFRVECLLAVSDRRASWSLNVHNSTTWSINRMTFPQLALRQIGDSGEDDFLVIPHGSGGLRREPIRTRTEFSGRYPGGWCTMQFLSHYDNDCGLYIATHDPYASTKDFAVKADGASIAVSVAWPAPDSGVPGNDWLSSGEAVLESFRGDWFDAAQVYKRWVAKQPWWPEGETCGRSDTPPWFEDIAVWAQTGGSPEQVVEPVKKFAIYMGAPTALHWYNWHVIPFDNDYPHYFPYKEGFPEGVKALQKAGVRVMPYINGRLWDTDLDDFKNNAVRFCTKDEKGQPYIETYGSGEKLCPMCPTTQLWQQTVRELVLRLVGPGVGVDAVYIDQVAAATPPLCFDQTHGHPLGGGCWWTTRGYWPMLAELQRKLSQLYPDKALTTECNAEPYVHVFDGYLTWHFQYQDQIPLFAAVYGGKIQLFSRAYQGDSWKGLAMRMKTGQALVFGEQLGWINPGVISDAESAAFLRRMARLRYALRDYLARGEMARPPMLKGDVPTVTADWEWGGKQPVTTPAVLSGAWRAKDGRLALVFVNVSDTAQTAEFEFDAERYGFVESPFLVVTPRTELGAGEPVREKRNFKRLIRLEPQDALALEISVGR